MSDLNHPVHKTVDFIRFDARFDIFKMAMFQVKVFGCDAWSVVVG